MIDIDLTARRGAFALEAAFTLPMTGIAAIWGPSGSGKTSLLRAIAGLDRTSGTVKVETQTWQDNHTFLPPHKRRVGYVFQEASLFPHLDVRGNLDFASRRAVKAARFDEIVTTLGVTPLLGRTVHDLSGGERQRVALARALLSSPVLLLMDEPLSSLDRAARSDILPLIRAVGARLPVLYVTHDPSEVMALADRVLTIEAGQVRAAPLPSPDDLKTLDRDQVEALALAALQLGLTPGRLSADTQAT